MKTEKASKPVKAMNPEPLQNLIDGVFRDADQLIQFKNELHQRELDYDPIQQLEEHAWKERDFYEGFDTVPFWDFSDKIGMINIAFDALDEVHKNYPDGNERSLQARREITELIQHIGFFRTFIELKRDQCRDYLDKVAMVNREHNSTIRKVKK